MTIATIFDAAADYLDRYGWMQGCPSLVPFTPLCAAVALGKVGDINCAATDVLAHAIDGSFAPETIFYWNDAPGRTKEEVTAMLRGLAAIERAKENACQPSTSIAKDAVPA